MHRCALSSMLSYISCTIDDGDIMVGAQSRMGSDPNPLFQVLMQEVTLHHPNIVNANKNTDIKYSTPTFLSRVAKYR